MNEGGITKQNGRGGGRGLMRNETNDNQLENNKRWRKILTASETISILESYSLEESVFK